MKYLTAIALALIIVSCNKSGNSITDPEISTEEGKVAFTFKSSKAKALDFPEPTNVRVLVRRFEDGNLRFNALSDVEVPTDTTVVISVPAQDGYQIDAFSYRDSTISLKPILKVDQVTDISVIPDKVTDVSLVLEPVSPTFSVPDSVEKGDNFDVTANFGDFFTVPVSYNSQYLSYLKTDSLYLNEFTSKSTDFYDGGDGSSDLEWDAVSITSFGNKYAYFQVISKLSADEYYLDGENKFSFILNYPNPFIEDTIKTFVKIPEGGIGVDVVY